jgi:hypothetical protein
MSNFKNLKILLKKHYIIHSLASACAISATLPLCFEMVYLVNIVLQHYAAVCKVASRVAKDGPKDREAVLRNSWIWVFGGCFISLFI